MTLHARIAHALGWTLAETQSFSLLTLRDLVRPVDAKLAYLITDALAGAITESPSESLPFGVAHADDLVQPFCACGRVRSTCDRSRKGCTK